MHSVRCKYAVRQLTKEPIISMSTYRWSTRCGPSHQRYCVFSWPWPDFRMKKNIQFSQGFVARYPYPYSFPPRSVLVWNYCKNILATGTSTSFARALSGTFARKELTFWMDKKSKMLRLALGLPRIVSTTCLAFVLFINRTTHQRVLGLIVWYHTSQIFRSYICIKIHTVLPVNCSRSQAETRRTLFRHTSWRLWQLGIIERESVMLSP